MVLTGLCQRNPDKVRLINFNWPYCVFQKPVQPNFQLYYFYFLPNQAQTHLDYFNVLDKLWANEFSVFFCYISFNQAQIHLAHVKVLDEFWGEISLKSDNR